MPSIPGHSFQKRDKHPVCGQALCRPQNPHHSADEKEQWEKKIADINEGKKILCVREWTGRPYNSEQADIKQFVQVGLQDITITYGVDDETPQAWVDGKPVPVELLAKNDGLELSDFIEWFFGSVHKGNVFKGKIIHFTDFRY